jgi:hypothetical protein
LVNFLFTSPIATILERFQDTSTQVFFDTELSDQLQKAVKQDKNPFASLQPFATDHLIQYRKIPVSMCLESALK